MEDQGHRAPLNSIFASQFKHITRKKWKVFVLKVAILDPHKAFSWMYCIDQGWIYHNVAQYQLGAPRSNCKTFFDLPYIWQKDLAKIPKVPWAQHDENPARQ